MKYDIKELVSYVIIILVLSVIFNEFINNVLSSLVFGVIMGNYLTMMILDEKSKIGEMAYNVSTIIFAFQIFYFVVAGISVIFFPFVGVGLLSQKFTLSMSIPFFIIVCLIELSFLFGNERLILKIPLFVVFLVMDCIFFLVFIYMPISLFN